MRLMSAASAFCLAFYLKALIIPFSNNVSAARISGSQSVNTSVSDCPDDDTFDDFNLTGSLPSMNDSLDGSNLKDEWHGQYELLGPKICATAVLVDVAHALARLALDKRVQQEVFVVQNYREAQIIVTPFKVGFTRNQTAFGMYLAVRVMLPSSSRFPACRYTFFKGPEKMGKIEFVGTPCCSGPGGADLANASSPLVDRSNGTSLVGFQANVGQSKSAAPTLMNVMNDDNPSMELDCSWHGQKVQPRTAMLTPSAVLTSSLILNEDPFSQPTMRQIIADPDLGMTISIQAIPQPSSSAPPWSFYWVIQGLSKMPEKMADQRDWREMTMTVKVDGCPIGTISLIKGIVQSGPNLSSTGNSNGSIHIA